MDQLRALADSLTALQAPPSLEDASVTAFYASPAVGPEYVWPTLRAFSAEHGFRVMLVEAAGAVGKSAAAAALSKRLKWPIVNAAQAQVGSYSLSGLVHDALGFESNYLSEIASGRAGLIEVFSPDR